MRSSPRGVRHTLLGFWTVTALAVGTLHAQDLRQVSEPVFPPTALRLRARLVAVQGGRTLSARDESKLDTARIQNALNHCPPGRAVELVPDGVRKAFLSGPLRLRPGVTLRIAQGAILFGSRNPRDYDRWPGGCGVLSRRGTGCRPLILADYAPNAALMGPGTIDGRGGATLMGKTFSWWQLARQAQVRNLHQNCPRLIEISHSDNFTLYRILLRNSPNFHVLYRDGKGFTAWGVIIDTPGTARNTDGIDPSSATDVTITHCFIHAGDDDVAIKAGSAGPSSHITVADNHFYTGHGMSIGSNTNGGVRDIRVRRLTIDGANNGLRIKSNSSRGGRVENVLYQDVCIRRTPRPIVMDSHYSFYGSRRDEIPTFTDIVLRDIHIFGPGRILLDGYDATHRLRVTFDDVILEAPTRVRFRADYARIRLGPGPVNFLPSGNDVTILGMPGQGRPYPCQGRFKPMPSHP